MLHIHGSDHLNYQLGMATVLAPVIVSFDAVTNLYTLNPACHRALSSYITAYRAGSVQNVTGAAARPGTRPERRAAKASWRR